MAGAVLKKRNTIESMSLLYMLEVSLPSSLLAYGVLHRNNMGNPYEEFSSLFAYEMAMRGRKNYKYWSTESIATLDHLRVKHPEVYKTIKENLNMFDENFGEVNFELL